MESNQTEFIIEMDNENIIGKGGFGTVYPAYEKGDYLKKTKYAAKSVPELVRTNQKEMTAFQNEILIATQFENENLVKFHGLTDVDNHMYMIFEYCNGGDLNAFSKNYRNKFNKQISEKDALIIIKGITNGLYCLHRNGITHHDIKPANILLKFQNEEALENLDLTQCEVKISDFGLAKYRASDDGSGIGGTPTYMDPIIIVDKIRDIKKGKYTVPISQTNKISLESICFIDSCLKREQEARKSSEELAYSRFLTRPYEKFNFIIQDNVEEIIQNENLREKNEYVLLNIYEKEYFEHLIDL